MFNLVTLKAKLIALAASFALGGVLASGAAYKIHGWRVDSLRTAWAIEKDAAVETAKTETQKICDENNALTKEEAHALRIKNDATAARYYKLLKYTGGSTSAAAAPGNTGRVDGTPGSAVPTVHLTISEWAHIARRNDDQASALTTLQDFVAGIYKAHGQENLLPDEFKTD